MEEKKRDSGSQRLEIPILVLACTAAVVVLFPQAYVPRWQTYVKRCKRSPGQQLDDILLCQLVLRAEDDGGFRYLTDT